ncbi:glycosyltransferase family 4 protein [Lactococcus lactis]|uniref:glycosyltransferase family 4 protein n=1 Tax=Lactococcus lactis TaxID=1358 RepID=UPI00165290BD|nr:glycosyltransferase [Lactococcus lactis]QNL92856.1 glycosyltransferase [Lactococcus lactis]
MKVVIVGPDSLEKGGISTVINNISNNTDVKDVSFIEYKSWKSGKLYFRIMYSIIKLVFFPLFLLKNEVDIVYIHFAHNGSFTRKTYYSKISKIFQKKIVLHSHSSSFDVYYNGLSNSKKQNVQRIFRDYCDCLIVLGEKWESFYHNQIQVPSEKIEILHNAVLCPPVYSYNSSSPIVTMFGRLGVRKGTYDILRVAKKLKENNQKIQIKLYGDGDIESVRDIIKTDNLNNVSIEGWVYGESKFNAMKEAALNILPSYNEGMPMSILETMALGVPNISTDVGSIGEVIKDEINGFLILPGDEEKLYNIISKYMNSSDDKYKLYISDKARKTITENFNIQNYGEKLKMILEKTKEKNE